MNQTIYNDTFAACQAGGMSNGESHDYATEKATTLAAPLPRTFRLRRVNKIKSVGPRTLPLPEWVKGYTKAILAKIAACKKEGTVGISADNLFAITVRDVPAYGSPRGTNATWALRQTFNDILRRPDIKPFIIA